MSVKHITRNMEKLLKKLKKSLKKNDINQVNEYLKQAFEISGSNFFIILKSNLYDMFGEDYKKVNNFLLLIENNDYICLNFSEESLCFCQNIRKIYKEFLPIYQDTRNNKNQMIGILLNKNKRNIRSVLYCFEQLIFSEYKKHSNEKCLEIYSQFLYDTNLIDTSIELSKIRKISLKNSKVIDFVKELITVYSLIIEFKNNFFDLLSGRYSFSYENDCYVFEPSKNNIDLISALYEANRNQRKMLSLQREESPTFSVFREKSLEFLYTDLGYKINDEIDDGITIQDVCYVWNSIYGFVDKNASLKPIWLKIDYDEVIKGDLKKNISREKFNRVIEKYFVSSIDDVDLYLYPIQKYKCQYLILNWGTRIELTYLLNNIVPKVIDKKFYEAEIIGDLRIIKQILFKNDDAFLVFPRNIEFKGLSIEIDLMFIYNKTLFIADVKHTMKKFESISNLRKLNYTYDGIIQVDYICQFIKKNKKLFVEKLKKEKKIDIPDFEEVKGFLITNEGKFSGVNLSRDIPIVTREDLWRFFAYPSVLIEEISGASFIKKHWWDFSKKPSLGNFLTYLDNPFKDNYIFQEYVVIKQTKLCINGQTFIYKKYEIDYEELFSSSKYKERKYRVLIEQKKINKMRNKATSFVKNSFYVIDFTKSYDPVTVKNVKDVRYWIELQNEFAKFDDTSNRR